jgi:type II secretory pathway predicted ATPase ExeA
MGGGYAPLSRPRTLVSHPWQARVPLTPPDGVIDESTALMKNELWVSLDFRRSYLLAHRCFSSPPCKPMFPVVPSCQSTSGAVMDAYEHFKLRKPPFDPQPDPDFFFDIPGHAEVLATLQYVVAARKGGCVVVGESGCGKTLLARMVAVAAAETTLVLWVHAGAQPRGQTSVSVYPSRRHVREQEVAAPEKTTLATETHSAEFRSEPPLLIVDCADELAAEGWADVIAWFSNELRYPKPANVLLFGLPRLLDVLTSPELVRLRRRVFRACRIEPLTRELSKDYIRARIAAAGGHAGDIFSEEILDEIARVGKGNPALLNQLCDNALLEAFGEGRDRVATSDVGNAMRAMLTERLKERAALVAPMQAGRLALPPVRSPMPWYACDPVGGVAPVLSRAIPGVQVGEVEDTVDVRLKELTERVSQALSVISELEDGSSERAFPPEGSGLRTVAAESTTVHV